MSQNVRRVWSKMNNLFQTVRSSTLAFCLRFTKYVSEWATDLRTISPNVRVTAFWPPCTYRALSVLFCSRLDSKFKCNSHSYELSEFREKKSSASVQSITLIETLARSFLIIRNLPVKEIISSRHLGSGSWSD